MSDRITIQFPADRDYDLYFRVFCWADDTPYAAIEARLLLILVPRNPPMMLCLQAIARTANDSQYEGR